MSKKEQLPCNCRVLKFNNVTAISGFVFDLTEGPTYGDGISNATFVSDEHIREIYEYINIMEKERGYIPTSPPHPNGIIDLHNILRPSFVCADNFNVAKNIIDVLREDNVYQWSPGCWPIIPVKFNLKGELVNQSGQSPHFIHINHLTDLRNALCFKTGYLVVAAYNINGGADRMRFFYVSPSGQIIQTAADAETNTETGYSWSNLAGICVDGGLKDIWCVLTEEQKSSAGAIRRFRYDGSSYEELKTDREFNNPDTTNNLISNSTFMSSSENAIPDDWTYATFTKREVGYYDMIGDSRLDIGRRKASRRWL
ncbi:MAG: hypothetical protein DRZ76_01390 [Candidatus Nealsonbacteria bacterium]|nr:MAG: hypothetical protein DRZ76_01390 [Candidatus Nealsonbacteria bacterium]